MPYLVADGGMVYAFMNEPGSHVAALRGADGSIAWTSPALHSGDSTPAVDATRVYVGLGGGRTFALDRATGAILWEHQTCCTGGGGTSPVLNGGLVYAEAEGFKVLDAATGQMVGTYIDHNGSDHSQPAFAGSLGIFRAAAGLIAAGADGATAGPSPARRGGRSPRTATPTRSCSVPASTIRPSLVALDLASGAPKWCADLGVRSYPDGTVGPVSGGLGLIVVAVDDRLVAFGNGGGGSTCGARPPPAAARLRTAGDGAAAAPARASRSTAAPAPARASRCARRARSSCSASARG